MKMKWAHSLPYNSIANLYETHRNPQLLQTEDAQQGLVLYTVHDGFMYAYIGYRFQNAHKTLPSHIMCNLKYKSND